MNHVEISGDAENQYIIMLRMESNGEYACLIDFSRDMTSYLLGSNIYRLAPAYKHSLDKYTLLKISLLKFCIEPACPDLSWLTQITFRIF